MEKQPLLDELAQAFLSKPWDNCTLQDTESLAVQYPAVAAAQLLYAQKLKNANPEQSSGQWQRTLLYFNHPYLLQYIFNKDEKVQPVPEIIAPITVAPENVAQVIIADDDEEYSAVPDDDGQPEVQLPAFTFEAFDPAKAQLAFTPYHTVDYFASQGIKGSADIAPGTFGKQLKSFTEWLKEMRRLPQAAVSANFSVNEQQSVDTLAEKSLQGENAITDAMAQVWAKQGNVKKAIDIYQKLSLQIPSKKAYFAAKIDHLKKSL